METTRESEFSRLLDFYSLWAPDADTADRWTLAIVASLVTGGRLTFDGVAEAIVLGWRARDGLAALSGQISAAV